LTLTTLALYHVPYSSFASHLSPATHASGGQTCVPASQHRRLHQHQHGQC
jgi:hypothetical protein